MPWKRILKELYETDRYFAWIEAVALKNAKAIPMWSFLPDHRGQTITHSPMQPMDALI